MLCNADSPNVRSDDLRTAVKLAILPRSIYRDQPPPSEDNMPPPPSPPASKAPPKPDETSSAEDKADQDEQVLVRNATQWVPLFYRRAF
jgi:Mg-chelatase subunit ChlI